jgi:hypothetical protein
VSAEDVRKERHAKDSDPSARPPGTSGGGSGGRSGSERTPF